MHDEIFDKEIDFHGVRLKYPGWVNWIAMDEDSEIYGYEKEPLIVFGLGEWRPNCPEFMSVKLARDTYAICPWTESLIKTPKNETGEGDNMKNRQPKAWRFKTSQEVDMNEVFSDISRSNPIGVIRSIGGGFIAVALHRSLAEIILSKEELKGAGNTNVMVAHFSSMEEVKELINLAKNANRSLGYETEYEVFYPSIS